MKIMWFSVSALALCIAAPVAVKASTPAAQPSPSATQYQDQNHDWDRPPDGYRDAQRQGFHEGMEAARRDFQNNRHADADDHDAYKHPPVQGDEARRDYREGFKEGYHRAVEHMRHDRDNDQPHF